MNKPIPDPHGPWLPRWFRQEPLPPTAVTELDTTVRRLGILYTDKVLPVPHATILPSQSVHTGIPELVEAMLLVRATGTAVDVAIVTTGEVVSDPQGP